MGCSNDWLLDQIRGTANMIGKVFKRETIMIELAEIEDEEGKILDGNDCLNQLVIDEKFDLATEFIHNQLKRLSPYNYNRLVDVYIIYLQLLDSEVRERNKLKNETIQKIHETLKQFSW